MNSIFIFINHFFVIYGHKFFYYIIFINNIFYFPVKFFIRISQIFIFITHP